MEDRHETTPVLAEPPCAPVPPRLAQSASPVPVLLDRETPEERWKREHLNQHLQLVTLAQFNALRRRERRFERIVVAVGACFDLMVVVLAVREFLL